MEERAASQDEGASTPSRISLANLLTPSQSPKLRANGSIESSPAGPSAGAAKNIEHISITSSSVDEDVVMLESSQALRASGNPKTDTSDSQPTRNAVAAAEDEDEDDADDRNFGEDGEEDVGDEDDDDEDTDDEDDEDDDDDDDEEDSESGGDRSDVEGVERALGDDPTSEKKENGLAGDVTMTQGDIQSSKGDEGGSTLQNGILHSQKKKLAKRRSPSVEVDPLPTGPPPRPTVRLKFDLRKEDDDPYMINIPDEIYSILKERDQQNAWALWYESTVPAEFEGDEEEGGAEVSGAPADNGIDRSELGDLARLLEKYPANMPSGKAGSKNKKKSDMDYEIGDYDVRDPFVDDSELNVDEPTYTAKPSADGFFVVEGEIELEEVERNKIIQSGQDALAMASKRGQIPLGFGQNDGDAGGAGALFLELGPTASNVTVVNSMLSKHAVKFDILPSDGGKAAENSEGSEMMVVDGSDEVKNGSLTSEKESLRPLPLFQPIQPVKYPVERVPRRLEDEFIKLRQMAAKESWLKKSKFPPDLRDPLGVACRVAIALNEFNDNFFNWLPQIFPYNRHTLHKFVRRQMYDQHTGYMKQLMELNEAGFKRQIDELVPRLQREYDEAMVAWQARGSREATPIVDTAAAVAASANDRDAEAAGEGREGEDEPPVNKNAKPVRRWQWTEPFRETLFTIITIDNALTELRTEKNGLENVNEKISVINQRKDIYKRLIEFWPEKNWTTTTALSNQHGLYKRRVEKFAQMLHENKEGFVI